MLLFVDRALLPDRLASNVSIEIDDAGTIASVTAGTFALPGAQRLRGTLLPGMSNAHSHAFQRAIAGRAERRSAVDSFWSWRETMYAYASSLTPDSLYGVAFGAYRDMLAAGFTNVVEFHYIHRDPRGEWYADKAAMAEALIGAAKAAGIAVTLLPALYSYSDAGGKPLHERQKRFETQVEDVLEIAATLRSRHATDSGVVVGACAHSLRAVLPQQLTDLLAGSPHDAPIHLHVAEQRREVESVVEHLGTTPVAWLLEHFQVDARWNLVHATHMDERETGALARSGANVVLAPTTEANLGDGIFPLRRYVASGGSIAIGSDSNVTIGVAEELRWLEYVQRLAERSRNVMPSSPGDSNGEALYRAAASGGSRAAGRRCGAIAPGNRADLVLLDDAGQAAGDDVVDVYVFASTPLRPYRVMVSGKWAMLSPTSGM